MPNCKVVYDLFKDLCPKTSHASVQLAPQPHLLQVQAPGGLLQLSVCLMLTLQTTLHLFHCFLSKTRHLLQHLQ